MKHNAPVFFIFAFYWYVVINKTHPLNRREERDRHIDVKFYFIDVYILYIMRKNHKEK